MARINRKNYNTAGYSGFENSFAKVWHVNQGLEVLGTGLIDVGDTEATVNATVGRVEIGDEFTGAGLIKTYTILNSFVTENSIIQVSAYARLDDPAQLSVAVKQTPSNGEFIVAVVFTDPSETYTLIGVNIIFKVYNP